MTKLTVVERQALYKRWVRALKSGKYRQGRCKLRTKSGSMCCLGVLCDILDPKGWENTYAQFNSVRWVHRFGGSGYELNYNIAKKLGLREGQVALAELNDNSRWDGFTRVIDYIKKTLITKP